MVKTWARACMITPEFVGHTFAVHNGHKFINVFVSEEMVGHRLGEMAPTRTLQRPRRRAYQRSGFAHVRI